mmetsp:Transcript_25237/g.70595  ORF Transcript_25237/g.70595 Transcript_25237/m.70595 type:complete len:351 (+) Transcript_25237:2610-3662(+)
MAIMFERFLRLRFVSAAAACTVALLPGSRLRSSTSSGRAAASRMASRLRALTARKRSAAAVLATVRSSAPPTWCQPLVLAMVSSTVSSGMQPCSRTSSWAALLFSHSQRSASTHPAATCEMLPELTPQGPPSSSTSGDTIPASCRLAAMALPLARPATRRSTLCRAAEGRCGEETGWWWLSREVLRLPSRVEAAAAFSFSTAAWAPPASKIFCRCSASSRIARSARAPAAWTTAKSAVPFSRSRLTRAGMLSGGTLGEADASRVPPLPPDPAPSWPFRAPWIFSSAVAAASEASVAWYAAAASSEPRPGGSARSSSNATASSAARAARPCSPSCSATLPRALAAETTPGA